MALVKIKSEGPRNCELHQQKNVRNAGEDKEYTFSDADDPRAILVSLQRRYGKQTPAEKEEAAQEWGRPWNPSEPIENMFFKMEELYVQAVIAEVPYTQAQLTDQVLDKIKKTGLFINNVVT